MKLPRYKLRAVAALLRDAQAIEQPRGPVTAAVVDRAADELLRKASAAQRKARRDKR